MKSRKKILGPSLALGVFATLAAASGALARETALNLFGSAGSPWVRKVMIIMAEKGIDYARPPLVDGVRAIAAPAELNPLQNQPCEPTLILSDGTALYPSWAIVDYLESITTARGGGLKLSP